jgi:hypothetical protein
MGAGLICLQTSGNGRRIKVSVDCRGLETKLLDFEGWIGAKMQPQALLFLAALTWLVVGTALVFKGGQILAWSPAWLGTAFAVGSVKAYFILDKIARRNVQRLQGYSTPVFVGRMFAGRTWAIIAIMIILGRVLRLPGVAPELSGFFSLAVGWGLFVASRLSWQAWLDGRKTK